MTLLLIKWRWWWSPRTSPCQMVFRSDRTPLLWIVVLWYWSRDLSIDADQWSWWREQSLYI